MTSNDELFRSAIDHYRSGRGDEARRICRAIVAGQEDHGPAQAMLGLMAHRENDHDTAARCFSLASRAQPDQPLHRINLGAALLAAQRWDEAVAAMTSACLSFPHEAALWSCQGNAYAGQLAWARAEASFAHAARLEPDNATHSYNQALACDRDGRHKEAENQYRKTLARDPRHGDARNNLGLLMLAQGRNREAAECFTAGFIAGSHAGAGLNLSRCLAASGDTAKAIEIARHVAGAHPEMAEAHQCLGEACDAAGDHATAALNYRRALDLEPGNQAARAALYHALHAAGDMAGADLLRPIQ